MSQNEHDYWPNMLYDTREAQTRDGVDNNDTDLTLSGVIHYVELDVNNLRRWLAGHFVQAAPIGAPSGPLAKNDNGYIVYFSDRRNNKNTAVTSVETGEYGFEDVSNPTGRRRRGQRRDGWRRRWVAAHVNGRAALLRRRLQRQPRCWTCTAGSPGMSLPAR